MAGLVIIPSQRKYTEREANEIAEISGVKFIKVQHYLKFSDPKRGSPDQTSGFQHVVIRTNLDDRGAPSYTHEFYKNSNGQAIDGGRLFYCIPEPITGQLLGWIPDSEYNRNKLAGCFAGWIIEENRERERGKAARDPVLEKYQAVRLWKILDQEIAKDIDRRCEEILKTIPKGKTALEAMTEQTRENEELRLKLLEMEKKLETQRTLTEVYQKTTATQTTSPTSYAIHPVTMKTGDPKYVARERARAVVYARPEIKDLIATLKQKKRLGWSQTKIYNEQIKPLIDDQMNKYLEEMSGKETETNAINTGTDNDDN